VDYIAFKSIFIFQFLVRIIRDKGFFSFVIASIFLIIVLTVSKYNYFFIKVIL